MMSNENLILNKGVKYIKDDNYISDNYINIFQSLQNIIN